MSPLPFRQFLGESPRRERSRIHPLPRRGFYPRNGGKTTSNHRFGSGYFRLGPRNRASRRRKQLPELKEEKADTVCRALSALYPARYRGNHRLQPLQICERVVKVCRDKNLRLGWKKFFRYLCQYPVDTRQWRASDWSLSTGLQCAVLRGRNFARSRLNSESARRNACIRMLSCCKEIPYVQLPKQLRHYVPTGFYPPPFYEALRRDFRAQLDSHKEMGLGPREKRTRKLVYSSFGRLPLAGRYHILKDMPIFDGSTIVEYLYDTDCRTRRVTTKRVLKRVNRPSRKSRRKTYSDYVSESETDDVYNEYTW